MLRRTLGSGRMTAWIASWQALALPAVGLDTGIGCSRQGRWGTGRDRRPSQFRLAILHLSLFPVCGRSSQP